MSKNVDWGQQASWPAQPATLCEARRFVSDLLLVHRQPCLLERVRLVLSELAGNAVAHAGTPYVVSLQGVRHTVLLRVRDEAPPPPTSQDLRLPTHVGRGLYLVDAYSDAWGIAPERDGGKSVWALFSGEPVAILAP